MFDCVGFFQDLLITRPLGQFRILTIILVELVLLMDTKIFFFFFGGFNPYVENTFYVLNAITQPFLALNFHILKLTQ